MNKSLAILISLAIALFATGGRFDLLSSASHGTEGLTPTAASDGRCDIKGNVSYNDGRKIYHLPGQEDYDATKISPARGERWFCSEQDALNAGWVRATR